MLFSKLCTTASKQQFLEHISMATSNILRHFFLKLGYFSIKQILLFPLKPFLHETDSAFIKLSFVVTD